MSGDNLAPECELSTISRLSSDVRRSTNRADSHFALHITGHMRAAPRGLGAARGPPPQSGGGETFGAESEPLDRAYVHERAVAAHTELIDGA